MNGNYYWTGVEHRPTLLDKVQTKRQTVQAELADLDKLIELLQANPGYEEVRELLQRVKL